jgi:hypothetical protein
VGRSRISKRTKPLLQRLLTITTYFSVTNNYQLKTNHGTSSGYPTLAYGGSIPLVGFQTENKQMKRRKFLVGMGSLAAGGGAAMGTGAFTSVSANRSVTVQVASDRNAYLALSQITNSENSQQYTTTASDGQLNLFTSQNVQGEGFNTGITWVDDLFQITNQSTQKQYVWMVKDGIKGRDKAVGFYVGTAPSDGSDPEYQISVGSNDVAPRDLQPLKPYDGTVVPDEGTHASPLDAGSSVNIGMVVDTRQLGDYSPPIELLEKLTVQSVADPDSLPARDNGKADLDPT